MKIKLIPIGFIAIKFIFLLSLSQICLSQSINSSDFLIPPSPDAAALGKYGQYPVDLSSGLVKIEIPIYVIKSRKLELPISLSYHASGIRIDDISSWVGLGWSLNAGGVVTRSIEGLPDDFIFDYKSCNEFQYNDAEVLVNIGFGKVDNGSDHYYYNVANISGSFRYNIDHELIQIPYSNNIITNDLENSFTITADDGTKYFFGENEVSNNGYNSSWNSSWYLTSIISADGTDAIQFVYTDDNNDYSMITPTSICSFYNDPNGSMVTDGTLCNEESIGITTSVTKTKLLRKIIYSNGYIVFHTSDDRKDRRKYRLSEILVYDKSYQLIKSITFNHSYFESENPDDPDYTNHDNNYHYRLRLDGINYNNQNQQVIQKYTFGYNAIKLPPYYYNGNN